MKRVVNCKLEIIRKVNAKEESSLIEGRGYVSEDNNEKVIFFSSEDVKYKFIYKDDMLVINCNDSEYEFRLNEKMKGKIKSDDFIFEVTTIANKIEVLDNYIHLEYSLYQTSLIGLYITKLSFN